MTARRLITFLVPLVLLGHAAQRAQAAPKLVSVSPLGGQQGTVVDVELRGSELNGAFAVWFGPGSRFEATKAPAAPGNDTKAADGKKSSATAGIDMKVTKGP